MWIEEFVLMYDIDICRVDDRRFVWYWYAASLYTILLWHTVILWLLLHVTCTWLCMWLCMWLCTWLGAYSYDVMFTTTINIILSIITTTSSRIYDASMFCLQVSSHLFSTCYVSSLLLEVDISLTLVIESSIYFLFSSIPLDYTHFSIDKVFTHNITINIKHVQQHSWSHYHHT